MFIYKCTLIRVVDADTLDLEVDLGFHTFIRMRFRLAGIDAPEIRTEEGKAAKEFVWKWFMSRLAMGRDLVVHTTKDKQDKYGRYVAAIFDSKGASLIKDILAAGHAIEKVY